MGKSTQLSPGNECITDSRALDALQSAWEALADRSPGAHLFQSHAWLSAWLRHHPVSEGRARIFVSRRGDRLTAALPLCAHDVGWGKLRVRVLRVARDSADFCDALSDPDHPEDLQTLWHDILRLDDWHLMDLRYVRPESLLDTLARAVPLRVDSRPMDTAPYMDITTDWQNSVSKGQRSDWLRRRRRLEEQGPVTLTYARNTEEVDALLEEFATLHIARWAERGEVSAFHFPEFRASTREAYHRLLERRQFYLYRLACGDDTVSLGLYCLFGRHLLPYAYTFSEAYARFCPAHLLIMAVVEDMRARDLADIHDFGRGDEEYKLRWTQQALTLRRYLIARDGLRGASSFWWAGTAKPFLRRQAYLHRALRAYQAILRFRRVDR